MLDLAFVMRGKGVPFPVNTLAVALSIGTNALATGLIGYVYWSVSLLCRYLISHLF